MSTNITINNVNDRTGGKTEEIEMDCALQHLERVTLLYPHRYDPTYHLEVFEDVKELLFLTLTTNKKDVVKKDSRAVGMSNRSLPMLFDEAKATVGRTKFVSHSPGVWEIEVKSTTSPIILLAATTTTAPPPPAGESENTDGQDQPLPADSVGKNEDLDTVQPGAKTTDDDTPAEEMKAMQNFLEKQFKAIQIYKRDLVKLETDQMTRLALVKEYKQKIASTSADFQKIELTILFEKRHKIRGWDKAYFKKVKEYEDKKTSQIAGEGEETSAAG
ncbi:uncharacterized protein KY384_008911 [Bacidia gigantensis]|uniref:uncharacterized protein n=1 Tax=Bacidia gigantensis TaxID=2732470 RepID=UPI001D043B4C|nr:uncharacterized protein KY384_008911 [Bacidia gigantensis]KAG8525267.1 hypothetical protein KY384_008911 [Bacidia gigantensis]